MHVRRLLCLLLTILITLLIGCANGEETGTVIDYAGSITLNLHADTVWQEVTVKTFVDGDTTHFHFPREIIGSAVLKARYIGINTPESTGKIEEYGKKASAFTREKLSNAESIIVESDNSSWNHDSGGERYLVWVWYKPVGSDAYRNLNIELLQEGLAIANSSAQNRYGSTCMAAIAQAKALKRHVYSGEKDPDFYYGDAVEMTLKELRCNVRDYVGVKVAFSGIITMNDGSGIYIEDFDPDTGLTFGMSVYYGYGLNGKGLDILSVGNESRIVGTVQFYEAGGTYQVSGLSYRMMKPKDPNNIQMISEGHEPGYPVTDPAVFADGLVSLKDEDGQVTVYPYAELIQASSIEMRDLTVIHTYTTVDPDSSSYGAMTLTCSGNGHLVQIRVVPMKKEDGTSLTEGDLMNRVIDVKGVVGYFDGQYQIKVLSLKGLTIHD